jgi:hypothetical protein
LCRKNQVKGKGWVGEGKEGWERLESQPFLEQFSTVKHWSLGESHWLILWCSLDMGQRASLQPPAVISYTHHLGSINCHTTCSTFKGEFWVTH